MPFPGIFRKLFENGGAGPRLLKAILPFHADTHGSAGSDPITPESIGAMAANAKPGSASSADVAVKLKTSRAIDGVGFDGSAAITHYATCSTAAATAAKVVSLAGFALVTGAKVTVRFTVTNTAANPTLNVNGTGAKAMQYRNAAITAGALAANRTYTFVYDGSSWELVGDLDSNTTYTAASAAPKAAGTAAVGTSPKYAREDHVHPAQTSVSGSSGSCTGNAATATKLATARTIDGVGFDGSAAITHYAECSTAAATAAKTVSLTGFTLVKGAKVTVRFTATNTAANPTLNVGGTGAKAIQYRNAAITAGALAANRTYTFVYDGSSWELVGDLDSNTTYTAASTSKAGIVQLSDAVNSAASTTAATSKAAKTAYDKAVAATFPTGTKLLFHQAAAPTGWTKQTTVNDATLRVVSGSTGGGTGGSVAFSTLFAAGKAVTLSGNVGATTLTVAQLATHTHKTARLLNAQVGGTGSYYPVNRNESASEATGSSSSHTHTLSGKATIALNVKYTDVIICAKA